MGKRIALLFTACIALLVLGSLALAMQEDKPDSKSDQEKCLACHGPFEKLVKMPAAFKTPADETVNPHKYIPHDTEDVPKCTECHMPHEIPLKDKASVVKPKDVLFCYDSCHHAHNLQPCKNCH